MIAKHPPQYYIDGLKRYIRGANLVPKALTLVRWNLIYSIIIVFVFCFCHVEKEATF